MNIKTTMIRIAANTLGIILICGMVSAQTDPNHLADGPALGIGEKVPDFTLDKVLDRGTISRGTIGGLGKDLVIVDFWATNCTGCIKSFPKLDSLQKRFGTDVRFLLSTFEPEAQVRTFMERNPIGKRVQLMSVVEDTVLGARFPHRSIPHVVWIYKGVVIGLTGTEYINARNIQDVLEGKPVEWPAKSEVIAFDYDKPLLRLASNQQFTQNKLRYSALMGYQDGLKGMHGIAIDTTQGTRRGYFINQPVLNAYFLLHVKTMDIFSLNRPHVFITPNQLIAEGVDLHRIWYDREVSGYHAAWQREHSLTMEVMLPDSNQTDTAIYRFMIVELDRLLGFRTGFERHLVDCWVLKRIDGSSHVPKTTAAQDAALRNMLGKQQGTDQLIEKLNQRRGNPPVFDESGYDGELEMPEIDQTDIAGLNKRLRRFGLGFVIEKREVDFFAIRKEH